MAAQDLAVRLRVRAVFLSIVETPALDFLYGVAGPGIPATSSGDRWPSSATSTATAAPTDRGLEAHIVTNETAFAEGARLRSALALEVGDLDLAVGTATLSELEGGGTRPSTRRG